MIVEIPRLITLVFNKLCDAYVPLLTRVGESQISNDIFPLGEGIFCVPLMYDKIHQLSFHYKKELIIEISIIKCDDPL